MLSPYMACFSTMLLSETMAVALVSLWLAWAGRTDKGWTYWIALGLLGALVTLCRSILIVVPGGGLLVVTWRTREWARGLLAWLFWLCAWCRGHGATPPCWSMLRH